MGAEIAVGDSYKFEAPARGLRPAEIFLGEPSVTAPENVLMAAAATPGTTVLRNAASEPHVQDLARFLIALGAQVEGIGTRSEEHTSELQSRPHLVCRLLLEKKKKKQTQLYRRKYHTQT